MEINLKPKLTTYRTFQAILYLNRDSAGPLFLIFQRISVYVRYWAYGGSIFFNVLPPTPTLEIDHICQVESWQKSWTIFVALVRGRWLVARGFWTDIKILATNVKWHLDVVSVNFSNKNLTILSQHCVSLAQFSPTLYLFAFYAVSDLQNLPYQNKP